MEGLKFCMSCVGKRRAGDVVGRCEKEKDNGEEGARVDLRRTFRIFLRWMLIRRTRLMARLHQQAVQ